MPNLTLRFLAALLLFWSTPYAWGHQVPPLIETRALPELQAPFQPHPPIEFWTSHTPWSVDQTVYRYQQTCAGFWENPHWDLSHEQAWQALATIASNAPGDLNFANAHLRAMEYYVVNMTDAELYPLSLHMGSVASTVPTDSLVWIQLQSWRVTLLSGLMRWGESIPLLEEIEAALRREERSSTTAIKSVFAHLDCSTAYHAMGIPERAMDHLARAEIAFEREPRHEDSPYLFMHLTLHQLLLSSSREDHREVVDLLERARTSDLYPQLSTQVRAICDFRQKLALLKLGECEQEELVAAFEALMAATDPEHHPGEQGNQTYRLSALNYLGSHYIQKEQFEEARALYLRAGLHQQVGEAVQSFLKNEESTASINVELTRLLPHFVANLEGARIPGELHDWLRIAYDLRLKETTDTPLMPLGMGGDQFTDLSSLAESLVCAELQTGPVQGGAERALNISLQLESGRTLARHLNASPPTLTEIRSTLLDQGSGIYHMQVGWNFSRVFLIDRGKISVHKLGNSTEFIELSLQLKKDLHRAQDHGLAPGRLEKSVSAVEDFLLPRALADELLKRQWRSIAFSGFEGRSYVPMELLKLPDGRRLGDGWPTTYYPSLTVALALATRRSAKPITSDGTWLSLIATTAPDDMPAKERERLFALGSNVQSLPFSSKDRTNLFGSFPASVPLNYKAGPDATVESLRKGSAGSVGALFLMAHGGRDDDLAQSPGLLMRTAAGSTQVLGPSNLNTYEPPPFVMLVACGTTDAVAREGDDGAQHLVGALLRQGSDTVLAAHLPLRYEDSKRLSSSVLHGLTRKGLSPAEALWQARLKLGDEAGYPGRYLLHARGLADRPLHAPAPKPLPTGSNGQYALYLGIAAAALGFTALFVRKRGAA